MNENDFREIGRDIGKAVQDVLHSQEFIDIKSTINSTLRSTMNNVQESVGRAVNSQVPPQPRPAPQPVTRPAQASQQPKIKIPGSVAGPLFTVFGAIGLGLLAVLLLVYSFTALIKAVFSFFLSPIFFVLVTLLALCAVFVAWGIHLNRRTKRYKKYRELLNGCSFCALEYLASATGQTTRYVAKDLKKMIRLGLFPNGHLDKKQTCIMLDYETYRQYLKAEEEAARPKEPPKPQGELEATLSKGRDSIRQIREINDSIPDVEISEKLTKLEKVASAIFRYVEQHPEKLPEIRKMMSYYLPTTLKLVYAYQEFHEQSALQLETADSTRKDIEDALDTIIAAYFNLLENLIEDDAMDVSTDISVLKTLLAQEGLTDEEFRIKK